jgi:hypothetical protein
MPDLEYPSLYPEMVAAAQRATRVADAIAQVYFGPINQTVQVENFPPQQTLETRFRNAGMFLSTMVMVDTAATAFAVSGDQHVNHFCCTSDNAVAVTVGAPMTTGITDPVKGILIFFTQIGDGVVTLVPAPGITLIYPDGSTPTTYSKGATIGIESRNATQWVVTGNMGY